jgi:uncharacterized protein
LWAVTAPGAPTTYLMGSLHVLTPDHYPLSPRIEQAFAASTVLVQEVDIDELANPAMALTLAGKAMFTDGRTLDQVISANLYARVVEHAAKAGIPVIAVQRMKPWMAAVSIVGPALQAAGFTADAGVDQHFFQRAKTRGMERRALETVAYQFERLDQMPAAAQEAMLRSAISDLDAPRDSMQAIVDAWAHGDVAAIERLLVDTRKESPEVYERLLVERNRNWVAPVESCLNEKISCFIVVGAAHLAGPDSLVALLREKGYKVEQQ